MNSSAALLIVISSVFHVVWNMLGKKETPGAAFFMLTTLSIVLIMFPVYILYGGVIADLPVMWKFFAAAGFFQAVYYTGLAGGYRHGDMSAAYPLARALPVLTVPAAGAVIHAGSGLDPVSVSGMVLVFSGCAVLPLAASGGKGIGRYFSRSVMYAVLAAAGTTGYTLVDSAGMSLLRTYAGGGTGISGTAVSAVYISFEMLMALVFISVYVMAGKKERGKAVMIIRKRRLNAFTAGFFILAAYGIVLITYPMVKDVSYVSAFRQVSIPMGVLAGILILKEKPGFWKLAGSVLISAGLILVYI